jgi:neutral ceramidase
MMKNATAFLVLLISVICSSSGAVADQFQMGTATIEITPPVGYRMSGYFHERLSLGTKDPLIAKAMVFSQSDTMAAIVCCDIIGLSPQVTGLSRKQIGEQIGIPSENIAIAATHSHTGPLYWGVLREHFHALAIEKDGTDKAESFDYPEFLVKQLVAVVAQAKENLQAVTISAGYGFENRIAFNRRFMKKNGKVATWIGMNHPDVVGTAGPIDPEVGLLRFDSLEGNKPLASLTIYALHLDTVGGQQFSADFPYYLQRELSNEYGDQFTSVFGAGTCGDINHADTQTKKRNTAEQIGLYLAESVSKAMPGMEKVAKPALAVKREFVNAPKQYYTAEQIAQAKEDMHRVADGKFPFHKRVKACIITDLQLRPGSEIPLEVQVFRISSETAIVTLPGEVFVDLGLHIKNRSPFATTLVIELANDAPGYIPTKKAFAEGGYETINSRVVPGSGEKMAGVAIRLLNELYDGVQ